MAQEQNNWIKELYQKEFDRLYRVAYRLSGSVETAEGLVQDAFVLALLHQSELPSHPNPAGWLMKTLVNLANNERLRLSNRDLSLDAVADMPAAGPDSIGDLLPAKLPEEDRQILIWRFEQKLDYKEISNRLGLTEGACRNRVARAVARCRKLLDLNDLST